MAAEVEVSRIIETAAGALSLERLAALPTKFHPIRVIEAAVIAVHLILAIQSIEVCLNCKLIIAQQINLDNAFTDK